MPTNPSDFRERSAEVGFSGTPLDRLSERRDDAEFIEKLRLDPAARTLVLVRDMPVLKITGAASSPFFTLDEARGLGAWRESVLLGRDDNGPAFATLLDDTCARVEEPVERDGFLDKRTVTLPGRDDLAIIDLRSLATRGSLDRPTIAMLAGAKSLLYWHARHRFCSVCGTPTRVAAAGWRRECPACAATHFPRTDPVVIMLATDGENCLLGRQARFPKGMYSALAGFIEPGETIEEAVRREIREESGIEIGQIDYLASQPWPFPSTLMIGCLARTLTREIVVDKTELEDARWFTRDEARRMLENMSGEGFAAPQPLAIAHHLLRAWAIG